MRLSLKILLIILVHALRTVFLFGQFERIIIPGDLKQKTIITEPATLNKGFLRTEIGAIYSFGDKIFDEENKKNYFPVDNGWSKSSTYSLNLLFGISNRMEVYASIPFVNSQIFISI